MQAKIIIALVLILALLASHTGAYLKGHANGKHAAEATAARIQNLALKTAIDERDLQTRRANALAADVTALGQKQAEQQTKIVEVYRDRIVKVPTVTSNRACLSAAAVGLLNSASTANPAASASAAATPGGLASSPAPSPAAPAPSDTTQGATDTDVASWALAAQQLYSQCAARVTGWQLFWAKKVCD